MNTRAVIGEGLDWLFHLMLWGAIVALLFVAVGCEVTIKDDSSSPMMTAIASIAGAGLISLLGIRRAVCRSRERSDKGTYRDHKDLHDQALHRGITPRTRGQTIPRP